MKVARALGISLLVVLAAGAVLFVASPFLFSWETDRALARNHEAVSKISLACSGDTKQTIERWQLTGHSVACRRNGVEHGPWQAWDNARLHIRGEFRDGARHGTWQVHNADGSVYRTVHYESGKELSNVVH